MEEVAAVFKTLSEKPFDSKRSMLDVTTVMVTSEFGRTMKQIYTDFDNCGTDHNPLPNTILVRDKGIKGGMAVGYSEVDEVGVKLSGAHKLTRLIWQDLKPMNKSIITR